MITVEDVQKENIQKGTEAQKANEELLKTGTNSAVKKSYLPWVLLAIGAMIAGYFFWKKNKEGSGNAGVSG